MRARRIERSLGGQLRNGGVRASRGDGEQTQWREQAEATEAGERAGGGAGQGAQSWRNAAGVGAGAGRWRRAANAGAGVEGSGGWRVMGLERSRALYAFAARLGQRETRCAARPRTQQRHETSDAGTPASSLGRRLPCRLLGALCSLFFRLACPGHSWRGTRSHASWSHGPAGLATAAVHRRSARPLAAASAGVAGAPADQLVAGAGSGVPERRLLDRARDRRHPRCCKPSRNK